MGDPEGEQRRQEDKRGELQLHLKYRACRDSYFFSSRLEENSLEITCTRSQSCHSYVF